MSVKLQNGQKLGHVTRIMLCEVRNRPKIQAFIQWESSHQLYNFVSLSDTAFYVTGFGWMGS